MKQNLNVMQTTTIERYISKVMEGDYTCFRSKGKNYTGTVMAVDFTEDGVNYTMEDDEGNLHGPVSNDNIMPTRAYNSLSAVANSM